MKKIKETSKESYKITNFVAMNIKMEHKTSFAAASLTEEEIISQCNLIVWNDDINTFDWVIDTLVEICEMTEEQAEQCALFIHLKGKYAVKKGTYEKLKPMCDAITERGIGATIEEMAF